MKVVSLHTMNLYGGVEVQLHAFFNISPRLRLLEVRFTPQPFYLQRKCVCVSQIPLRKRLEWAPEPVHMFDMRGKNLSPFQNCPTHREVTCNLKVVIQNEMNNNGSLEYLLLFSVRQSPSFLVTSNMLRMEWFVLEGSTVLDYLCKTQS